MPPATFALSGTIRAPDNALIDSDVNDPAATYASNDAFENPQDLPNPVILGGYVNAAGAGPDGRSFDEGDVRDFFRVHLTANQSITLLIASDSEDLDLYLYDDLQTLVDAAMGTGSQESLKAPVNGIYFIEVRVSDNSASNYILTIGQDSPADLSETLRLSDQFVPGELIVRFEEDAGPFVRTRSLPGPGDRLWGMQIEAGTPRRAMLLCLGKDGGRQEAFRALGIRTDRHRRIHQSAPPHLQDKADTLAVVKSLRRQKGVRYAQPNYIRTAFATPNDLLYPRQWQYPLINLPQSWDISAGNDEVIIAVVDTGVLLNHPDLANRLTSDGYDFISDPARALDGDGIDDNPDDPGDDSPGGSSFHGTHVAGIIAAATNNSTGVAGTTWLGKIMPVRVLGRGASGTDFDILQGVLYAAGLENSSGSLPTQRADIINLSLGGSSFSPVAAEVIAKIRAAGVIIVAAAGNGATNVPVYPAAYDGVVSVSAVDLKKELAWYSNFGNTIDLAAPGGDNRIDFNGDGFPDGVLNTCGDDTSGTIEYDYCFLQGTSMAAPHVAGVAALMKAVYPDLTPEQFDILISNENENRITEDIGPAGRDSQFGYGLIDAYAALAAAQNLAGGGVLPLTLIVNPTAVNLGSQSTATLRVEMAGGNPGDTLIIDSVSTDVAWLDITAQSVDDDGLGIYQIVVNREPDGVPLNPGIYTATITVDAAEPTISDVEVPVSLQVVTPIVGGNAGFHYVLLLDSDTLEFQDQKNVAYDENLGENGGYAYTFTDVPVGTYKIFAGTDSNNNFFIGDGGEAYGAYLTLDQPVAVSVTQDMDGLDFTTHFDVSFPTELDVNGPERPVLERYGNRNLLK